jgi:hypothetical protein
VSDVYSSISNELLIIYVVLNAEYLRRMVLKWLWTREASSSLKVCSVV